MKIFRVNGILKPVNIVILFPLFPLFVFSSPEPLAHGELL